MRVTARQIILGYRLRWAMEVLQSQDIKFTRDAFFFLVDRHCLGVKNAFAKILTRVEYKRKIVREADACKTPGTVVALLRRVGASQRCQQSLQTEASLKIVVL